MPGKAASVRLTDAYRAQVVALRRRSLVVVSGLWTLEQGSLDRSFAEWLTTAERVVTASQAQAARLSAAFVAAFVSSELGETVDPPPIAVDDYAGVTADGRSVRAELAPALFTVKRALSAGETFDRASQMGQARATRNAEAEVAAAADRALDDTLTAEPRVRGWRRVASARSCGACLASATGAVQRDRAVLLRHPSCSCTKEPVVAGVTERARRKTGRELFDDLSVDEQNRLFAGRGGEAKAELIRSGDVELEALASVDRQVTDRPAILTETPLERLS